MSETDRVLADGRFWLGHFLDGVSGTALNYLISFDDTDDPITRGTGYRGRQFGRWLQQTGLARLLCITRHQLLKSEEIPMTSQNSAVCLEIRVINVEPDALIDCALRFLRAVSAPSAAPAVCLARRGAVPADVIKFGKRCKGSVLSIEEATGLAQSPVLALEASSKEAHGKIGALAAVGLRSSEQDGRFIWLPKLRTLSGVIRMEDIGRNTGIHDARDLDGQRVRPEERIKLGGWVRPLLRGGGPVLFVERAKGRQDYEWRLLDKRVVKEMDQ